MAQPFSRRTALRGGTAAAVLALTGCGHRPPATTQIYPFAADITVPLGHGMMGGSWVSKSVADPLEARGFVLTGPELPVVWVSLDWCELRNDAYACWQTVLADAAGTQPERVMISTLHQHDAPVADLTAERILRERSLDGSVCDPDFHEVAVQRTARALKSARSTAQPVTHLGTGQARVQHVASNRRYQLPDGSVRWDRTSATRNAFAIAAEEGLIDPWLKTLSFWNGDQPLVTVSFYAVHPMSYYGQGEVSADFPGLARRARQQESPESFQLYVSGASGNVTAGKYNTGARENRAVLAERLRQAMAEAWEQTRRTPLPPWTFRSAELTLEPRSSTGYTEADLQAKLVPGEKPFSQCLAALGWSWRQRVNRGIPLQIPCLDFGSAAVVLLPGETYVDYQLVAQQLRPGDFIAVAGYGDGATGYVPTEAHWQENDTNLGDWCWVNPGSESRLRTALAQALGVPAYGVR